MERAKINLHHKDCMEDIRKMPDKAYDLAIVDVPYGINEDGTKNKTRSKGVYTKYEKIKN